jgi:hypothetical protein
MASSANKKKKEKKNKMLEWLFGKKPLVDPVVESEEKAAQLCTLGPQIQKLVREIESGDQPLNEVKGTIETNTARLGEIDSSLKKFEADVAKTLEVAEESLEGWNSVSGSDDVEADPVPQDTIDQFGENLRMLQEEHGLDKNEIRTLMETKRDALAARKQNVTHQREEVNSRKTRLQNTGEKIASELRTRSGLRKELLKFAALSKILPQE